jgi:tripartite-type tricarboxylate transporter receptor subunit TctC
MQAPSHPYTDPQAAVSPAAHPRRAVLSALAASLAWPLAGPATAQPAYPAKLVTLVIPYSPGGGTDIVGRMVAQRLSELWGQSVVVDNRPGANGVIGTQHVAKAAPDGSTLLLVVGSHAINPVLMKSIPYDTAKAFTPITVLARSPMVVVASTKGPYKDLQGVLAAARKDEVAYGYSEGQTRLTGEMLRQAGNLKLTGVPYKGGAPIMVDVIGGHLPLGVTSVLTALPHVNAGTLRVVATVADQRLALFPDAMTPKEAGLQGVESFSWYGLFGPAGMPPAIVEQIIRDLRKVTAEPAVAKQIQDQGASVVLSPPDEFRRFLDSELAKWAQVAQRGGIQPE